MNETDETIAAREKRVGDIEALYDVLEVSISSRKVTLMGEALTKRNADAVERMALLRRSHDDNFFVTIDSGKFKDGDTYRG